ncbi:MAG: type II toxin-antitoxin system VapB family antitoxin [Brevundimonas sp.]
MAFHIRDEKTDALARELSRRTGKGLTESGRLALEGELLRRDREVARRRAVVEAFLREMDALPKTGEVADKAFFDELSGD